jgi:hypothetical protein
MSFTCNRNACPDGQACTTLGQCAETIPPIELPPHPDDNPPRDAKRIEDMTLDDYRVGVAKLMKNLGTLP